MSKKYISFWIFCFIGLDFVSKILVEKIGKNFWIIPNFFRCYKTRNFNLALSIPLPTILQIFFSGVLLLLLIFFWRKLIEKNFWSDLAMILIFSGGIANFLQRIIFGFVTDFLVIWKFPIFNFADTFIFFGVTILFFLEIKKKSQNQ